MKAFKSLAVLALCVSAQAQDLTNYSTNRWTNVVQVLAITPVQGVCPECGAPNHHDRVVGSMEVHELVTAQSVRYGITNRVTIWTGVINKFIGTNTVIRQQRVQPGWTNPPIPPMTNSGASFIRTNSFDNRVASTAVYHGQLAPHDEWRHK